MQLFCQHLSGMVTILNRVKDSDTIEIIKSMIEYKEGIPVEEQRMIFAGKQLEDGRTIAECGIKDRSTIHVISKLRGC